MKTHLNEPQDEALKGANKAAAGCAIIIVAICCMALVLGGLYVLCL